MSLATEIKRRVCAKMSYLSGFQTGIDNNNMRFSWDSKNNKLPLSNIVKALQCLTQVKRNTTTLIRSILTKIEPTELAL